MGRLVSNSPARRIKTNRRSLTGRVALSSRESADFESSLERDWLVALDFNPSVRRIQEQPFTLHYSYLGVRRRYTPDILAEFVQYDGQVKTLVYEVKFREELRQSWAEFRPRFKAAIRYCRARDWRFKLVTETEIRTPYVQNAKFLRRYRDIPEQPLASKQLLYTLRALGETTPQALLAAAFWPTEHQMAAIPELWRLVVIGKISALLHDPLTMSTPIWLPGD